jgi:ABC-type transport system substrate-binding protein
MYTRRRFLTTASLAGAVGLLRAPRVLGAESALETTTLRFTRTPALCVAPLYVAEELLGAGYSPIYPCHVNPRDIRSHPIGTGPVKFVEFKPNERITVTRNPDLVS